MRSPDLAHRLIPVVAGLFILCLEPASGAEQASKTAKSGERKSTRKSAPAPKRAASGNIDEAVRTLAGQYAGKGWQIGVVILDETGKERVNLGGADAFAPASNQKILVVGAALGLLGPDFAYETTLACREAPQGGAIKDLIVRGTGDPNIPNRFENENPTAIFKAWAGELKGKGIQKVTGDLVMDDSFFDDVRFMPAWKTGQQGSWYEAEIGALSFNDNCIGVIAHATKPGQPPRIELVPPTAYVTVENKCRTVENAKSKKGVPNKNIPVFNRKDGTNEIEVTGTISSKTSSTGLNHVTVEDPGLYFGTVFQEVLRAEGIASEGKVVRGKMIERGGPSPSVLLQHRSTLALDLKVINKHSQNLHAEILLKALGARKGGEGSLAGGTRAIESFLKTAGIASSGLHIEDGSGLAAGNRISVSTLAGVLGWIQKQPSFGVYKDSLPVASVDGTLKKRFKAKSSAAHVFAKTGYIKGVSALAGYVEKGKKNWVFTVLINGLKGNDLLPARKLEEDIAEEVYLSIPE